VLGLVVASVLANGAGCDARVEEPAPPGTTPAARTGDPAPSSAPRPRGSASHACVEPLGDKPVREVKGPVPAPDCPPDRGPRPELALGAVGFPDAPEPVEVAVEIAKKNADRMRGLMYRTELAEGAGMLFVFEQERRLTFWMRNTCIPLDMIFISADGTIVGIEENTPTLTDDNFGPKCAAKYVLEVNAGWSRKNGIKPGMKVRLPPG
jgi:hypothetical protein